MADYYSRAGTIKRINRKARRNKRKAVRAENRRRRRLCKNCGDKRLYHNYYWIGLNPLALSCGRKGGGRFEPTRKLGADMRRKPRAFRGHR